MKNLVLGIGIFLSGLIIKSFDYGIKFIVNSMPHVAMTTGGYFGYIGLIIMILGLFFIVKGYTE